jgi:3-oxoadipate enol-lactonase
MPRGFACLDGSVYNGVMAQIRVGDRQVYYELHGHSASASTPTLALLNGIGGSCRGWLPLQVAEFAKNRQVLIFDHRGVGESSDPGGSFTTADLAGDTAALLETLEIQQADVLGAFMGGMVAQELALLRPDVVRRLTLVGCYARPDAKRRMLLEDWSAVANAGVGMESMLRKRLIWTLSEETLEQTDLIETMLDFFLKEDMPVDRGLFVRQCEACLRHDTTERLGSIQARTLILCGRDDQLTPPKFHRALADAIEGSRLVVLEFGGHLVMAESAVRFNQIVEQFLDE